MSAILDFRLLEVGGRGGGRRGRGGSHVGQCGFPGTAVGQLHFPDYEFRGGNNTSLLIRLLIRHLIRTRNSVGVQQKKDVYKISHDFKINTTANKIRILY